MPQAQRKTAIMLSMIVGVVIFFASIMGLWAVLNYTRGGTTESAQIFIGLASPVFYIPSILGAILISLGTYLKLAGDTLKGYGIVLGIGSAMIIGLIGAVWALMNSHS